MILYLRVILFVLFFYRVTIMRKIKIATLFFNFLFLLERITLYKFVLMLFFVCCILHTTNYNTTQNPSRALALFDLFTTHILYLERSSFVFLHSIQKSVLLQKPKSKPNHSFSDLFTSRTENKPYLTYTTSKLKTRPFFYNGQATFHFVFILAISKTTHTSCYTCCFIIRRYSLPSYHRGSFCSSRIDIS